MRGDLGAWRQYRCEDERVWETGLGTGRGLGDLALFQTSACLEQKA